MSTKRTLGTFPHHFLDLIIKCPKEWLDAEYTFSKNSKTMFSDWLSAIANSSPQNKDFIENTYKKDWEAQVLSVHETVWCHGRKKVVYCKFDSSKLNIGYLRIGFDAKGYSKFNWVMDWNVEVLSQNDEDYVISGHTLRNIVELMSRSFCFYFWGIFCDETELVKFLKIKKTKNKELGFIAYLNDSKVLSEILQVENSVALPRYRDKWVITDLLSFSCHELREDEISKRWQEYKEKKGLNFKTIEDVFRYFYSYRRKKEFVDGLMTELGYILEILRGGNFSAKFNEKTGKGIELLLCHNMTTDDEYFLSWDNVLNNPAIIAKDLMNWQARVLSQIGSLVRVYKKDISSMFDIINMSKTSIGTAYKLSPVESAYIEDIWGRVFVKDGKVWVKNSLEKKATELGIERKTNLGYCFYYIHKLEAYVGNINQKINSDPAYKAFLEKNLFWDNF